MGEIRRRSESEIAALTEAAFRRGATTEDVDALRSAIGTPPGAPSGAPSGDGDATGAGDGATVTAAEIPGVATGDDPGDRPPSARRPFLLGIAAGAALALAVVAVIAVPPLLRGELILGAERGSDDRPAPTASASGAADPSFPAGDAYGHGSDPAVAPSEADGVGIVPDRFSADITTISNTWTLLSSGLPGQGYPLPGNGTNAYAVWTTTTENGAQCYMAVEKRDDSDVAALGCVSGARIDSKVQLDLPSYIVTVSAFAGGASVEVGPAVPGPQG